MGTPNLRSLRPSELLRILNSTRLGTVTTESQLRSDRARAGLQIEKGGRIDLFAYLGWLSLEKRNPKRSRRTGYQLHKDSARKRQAELSREGREIGEIPPVADPDRRAESAASFRRHCEIYHPDVFYLPWSDDHLDLLGTIQTVFTLGGLHCFALPRGSGKTCICETAAEWAPLHGLQGYVLLLGADKVHAMELIESVKTELLSNELLAADFPEVVYAIRRMEGISNRCKGQRYRGNPTYLHWGASKIVLPTIPGSKASGAVIEATSLMSRIRGKKHKRANGSAIRPSAVIIEDPQTDQSARSPDQVAKRLGVINGAVLKLAGPDKRIAAVMPCTVIQPSDVADQLLNPLEHPAWQGRRCKFFYAEPTNQKLWGEYADILRRPGRYEDNLHAATEFYRQHRAAMDAGAKVGWEARYEPGEISAVQHGMNVKLLDSASYWTEYQNEHEIPGEGEADFCPAEEILKKTNPLRRGQIPHWATILVNYTDVHDKLLYFVVAAFDQRFQGAIVDWGTYPKQRSAYYVMRDAQATLGRKKPGAGKEGAIHAGLVALWEEQLGREWDREDGTVMRIRRGLVDERYQRETVHAAIRASRFSALIYPSRGVGVKASNKPFAEYYRKEGDRAGDHWRMAKPAMRSALRSVELDTNYWKSQLHRSLRTSQGDARCLSLFGYETNGRRPDHRLLADHIAKAEYYKMITDERARRTIQEWYERPNRPDNHLYDSAAGCMAAASIEGAVIPGTETKAKRARRRRRIRYL